MTGVNEHDVPADGASSTLTADDLDREQLEQLHAATLNASDSCFELKKLCATVLVPAGTLVALFTGKRLDVSVFVAGLLVITAFWLADAVGYYYQRSLRNFMVPIWQRRAERIPGGYDNVPKRKKIDPARAMFNWSMTYYLILALVVGLAFALFETRVIK
jgi:hypothetical protein